MRPVLFAIGYYVFAILVLFALAAALGPIYGHGGNPLIYVIYFFAAGGVVLAALELGCLVLGKKHAKGALLVHLLVLGALLIMLR
ncbi:hypothetical protein [Flaviaesturariibacter amylovorans]